MGLLQPLILTQQGEIGMEATGEREELAQPCLQPTAEQTSSTPIPLKRTNGQNNEESKTLTYVEVSK